ncbi:cytochrome bc complex cytochrome b subunit [Actinomycetota bacterium]|nr:cytochrome bc complex cytochrome b subunit [Actinomycetota bacterium]MDA9334198.1 cytochrome bc complex cytochrome b subunit [Actinomycetota bacterium]
MSATTDHPIEQVGGVTAKYVDQRLGSNKFLGRNLGKVFPDHWSFMLGEIALYSFIVVLLTGTFLTLFYDPSMVEVVYNGAYVPLKGVEMSQAYASTLDISFEVRGGLLIRQMHHWSALIFVAAIAVHMFRVFFTGAFRKPREFNWLVGVGLTALALGAGFTGYSLPDDLLSGTGLQIIRGILQSIPLVGTWSAFLMFGGEFPGTEIIPRLYAAHILLIPGLLLGLISAHLMMVWTQKHTQFPGPGRTNSNVVGYPLLPVYMAKAGGFFFIVFGIIALIGGLVTVNPIWIFGPYMPDQVSAGTQPDWYIGWLDGALRLMPNWESVIAGFTISWNVLIPSVIIPGILFTALAFYPFLEAWATGDKREHNLLERPRNAPVRTSIGVVAIVFYGILWIGGGNDIIATTFDLSFNALAWTLRVMLIAAPPIAFVVTKRICLGLQRKDREKLLHGYESGRVLRLPHGEFIEVHQPLNYKELAVISAKEDLPVLPAPVKTDPDGVRNPHYRIDQLRHKVSSFFLRDNIERPTDAEIEAGQAHAAHSAGLEAPLHEYELQDEDPVGHGGVLHHPGMPMTNQEQIDQRQS